VARTARRFLRRSDEPSLLREIEPEKITSYDVAKAAEKGDKLAKSIFEYTGKILGKACANMVVFSSPEAFIFFGGLSKAGDLLLEPLKRAYDENVMPNFRGKTKFLLSAIDGAGAAVLGAACLRKKKQ
jgi:glucokinase